MDSKFLIRTKTKEKLWSFLYYSLQVFRQMGRQRLNSMVASVL